MRASVKPQVETLEDRLAMSGLQIADLTSVAIDPVSTPPVSGRITGIAVDPTDPLGAERTGPFFNFESKRLVAPDATGGVWKTTNFLTVEPQPLAAGTALASVTDLVIDPFNPAASTQTNLGSGSDDIRADDGSTAAGITCPDNEWRYVNVRRY